MKESSKKILIGKIVGALGIKGELKVYSYAQGVESFIDSDEVFLSKQENAENNDCKAYKVQGARENGKQIILKLKEVSDRNTAESLVNYGVYISEESMEPLPEDIYYVKDLIGLTVIADETSAASSLDDCFDGPDDRAIGTIKDVIQNTAQDIYVVELKGAAESGKNSDVLVPAVKEFIKEVNVREGFIKVHFIEGMLP